MNLERLPNDKKLNLCKWYFFGGFALLPFLWCINAFWFYEEAFKRESYEEQRIIKRYVILSGIGGTIWFILLLTWIIVYQTNRADWGEFGEQISLLIPTGRP